METKRENKKRRRKEKQALTKEEPLQKKQKQKVEKSDAKELKNSTTEEQSAANVKQTTEKEEPSVQQRVSHKPSPGKKRRGYEKVIDPTKHIPVSELSATLAPLIISNLKSEFKITSFFPVQSEVIPTILKSIITSGGSGLLAGLDLDPSLFGSIGDIGGDICVCAPTGSGKTLAYAVPVVNTLLSRVIRRLRALILVPNRDLALQVKAVFDSLCKGSDLSVEVVFGQSSFKEDQRKLLLSDAKDAFCSPSPHSLVDILVATPGRLVDLLSQTRGFTLQHLQFLVIDEADRLLMQSYQDWLVKVLDASHYSPQEEGAHHRSSSSSSSSEPNRIEATTPRGLQKLRSVFTVPMTTSQLYRREVPPHPTTPGEEQSHLCKMLFSATLTHNPKKIASLKLHNPQFFTAAADGLFKLPESLEERMVHCPSKAHKPLILYYLLKTFQFQRTLCFTSSIESTHRLCKLMSLMLGEEAKGLIAEYSSTLSQKKRSEIVRKVSEGEIKIVVASDAMARGLDFEEIENVINYDVPPFIKTYVHRVGRTARAGKVGRTFTFLRGSEVLHFKEILQKVEHKKVKKLVVKMDDVEKLYSWEKYEAALQELAKSLKNKRTTKEEDAKVHTK